MQRKNTHIELVQALVSRNEDGDYDELIAKAKNMEYHDLSKSVKGIDPKVRLVLDLKKFPELADLMQDVLNCEYDESDNTRESDVEDLTVELHN